MYTLGTQSLVPENSTVISVLQHNGSPRPENATPRSSDEAFPAAADAVRLGDMVQLKSTEAMEVVSGMSIPRNLRWNVLQASKPHRFGVVLDVSGLGPVIIFIDSRWRCLIVWLSGRAHLRRVLSKPKICRTRLLMMMFLF